MDLTKKEILEQAMRDAIQDLKANGYEHWEIENEIKKIMFKTLKKGNDEWKL